MTEGLFLGHNHLCIYHFAVGWCRVSAVVPPSSDALTFLFALPNILYPHAKRFRQPASNQNRWRALHVFDHGDVVYADSWAPWKLLKRHSLWFPIMLQSIFHLYHLWTVSPVSLLLIPSLQVNTSMFLFNDVWKIYISKQFCINLLCAARRPAREFFSDYANRRLCLARRLMGISCLLDYYTSYSTLSAASSSFQPSDSPEDADAHIPSPVASWFHPLPSSQRDRGSAIHRGNMFKHLSF